VFSVIHELLTSVSQTVGSPTQEPSELVKTLLEERAAIRRQLEDVGIQVCVMISLVVVNILYMCSLVLWLAA